MTRQSTPIDAIAEGYLDEYLELVPEERVYLGRAGKEAEYSDYSPAGAEAVVAVERAALNSPIQGSAADIIKRAMLSIQADISSKGLQSNMLLQVHDELVFEVAPGELDELSAIVRAGMGGAADLQVPLDVKIGTGSNWDEAAH